MKFALRVFAIIISLLSVNTLAKECYSQSPTLSANNDLFEHQDAQKLTRREKRQLKKLMQKLEGKWQGGEASFECLGGETNARKKTAEKSLSIEARTISDNSIRLSSKLYSPKKRSKYSEHFSLFLAGDFLRLDTPSPSGDIELLSLDSNTVSFLTRFTVRNRQVVVIEDKDNPNPEVINTIRNSIIAVRPVDDSTEANTLPIEERKKQQAKKRKQSVDVEYLAGGALKEIIRTVHVKGRRLEINITTYTNGYLSSSHRWQAQRS